MKHLLITLSLCAVAGLGVGALRARRGACCLRNRVQR